MTVPKKVITLLSGICVLFVTSSCGSSHRNNWHFVVPKDYEGFLVIRFDCQGGKDLQSSGFTVLVNYSTQGIACSSMSFTNFFPNIGTPSCSETTGRTIPFLVNGSNLRPAPPKALCGGETSEATIQGRQFAWYIQWVGDPNRYAEFRNTDQYLQERNKFLSKAFGIELDR